MPDWMPESRIARSQRAVWRSFGSEVAIIVPGTSSVRTLNRVGGRVWELADGRPLSSILDQLVNEFEVDRTELERDVKAFLVDLGDRKLIEVDVG